MARAFRHRRLVRIPALFAAVAGCLLLGSLAAHADSQLVSGGPAESHVLFRIVIPQALALTVVDRGTRGPALRAGLRVDASGLPLATPAAHGQPLVRCRAEEDGSRWCTAALP